MSERVWHKGPPPHIGWWLTKDDVPTYYNLWRYWNGRRWSVACFEEEDGADGEVPYGGSYGPIEWTDYWPENARVPRLDPTDGHWTFNVDGVEPGDLPARIDIATRSCGLLLNRPSSFWDWEPLEDPTEVLREGDILAWRPAA